MGNIVPPSLTTRLRLDPDATLRRGPCQSRSGFGGRPRGWRLFGSRLYRDGLQAQLLRGRQRPDLVSERAVTTDGFPDPSDLSRNHRRIDRLHPAVTPWRGPGVQADRGPNAGRRTVKTGPWPILGSLDQSRTKRIPLDVPQHQSEVVNLLNGKGLESALPDMPAGMVMFLVPTDMGRQQPVNPPADVPIVPGPKNQMEMVGHQAIGQDPHGLPKRCFGDHVEERLKVLVLVENLRAGIAPVEHVIAVTSGRRSRRARHDEGPRSRENHFRTAPPILPRSLGELPVSPFGLIAGFGVGRGFAIWDPFPVQAPDKAPETCTWSTMSEGGRQLAEPQPRRKPDRLEVPKMRWTCESPVS